MKVISQVLAVVSLVSLMGSSISLASTATNASALQAGIIHAKNVVDKAIAGAGGHAGGTVGGTVGGGSPWFMESDVAESDALALPILMQASTTLGDAASMADQSKLAYLSFNIALGNFKFAMSCSNMGISRSQIARANTAAFQPPVGFLAAFGPELAAVVTELNSLRISQGCP